MFIGVKVAKLDMHNRKQSHKKLLSKVLNIYTHVKLCAIILIYCVEFMCSLLVILDLN